MPESDRIRQVNEVILSGKKKKKIICLKHWHSAQESDNNSMKVFDYLFVFFGLVEKKYIDILCWDISIMLTIGSCVLLSIPGGHMLETIGCCTGFNVSMEEENIHDDGQVLFTNFMVRLNFGGVPESVFWRFIKLHCMKSLFTKTHVTIDRGLKVIVNARLVL